MIYLKEFKDKNPEDLTELLTTLFSSVYNFERYVKNTDTFSDKDCENLQCYRNKNRSFDDILEIVNTYFGDKYSVADITKQLTSPIIITKNNTTYYPVFSSCIDIGKIVIYYYHGYLSIEDSYDNISSYKYGSKYSWRELLDMIKE